MNWLATLASSRTQPCPSSSGLSSCFSQPSTSMSPRSAEGQMKTSKGSSMRAVRAGAAVRASSAACLCCMGAASSAACLLCMGAPVEGLLLADTVPLVAGRLNPCCWLACSMGGRSRAGVGMDSAHKGSEGPEAGSGTGKAAAASGRPCVLGSVVTELIKSDTWTDTLGVNESALPRLCLVAHAPATSINALRRSARGCWASPPTARRGPHTLRLTTMQPERTHTSVTWPFQQLPSS
mmetsp:Transcript_12493/g.34118  ORF Transcript_12493/g.34118 Transcript_12493/m.34118 type:complete len:237 (-) Transcript_12493:127-837(-)